MPPVVTDEAPEVDHCRRVSNEDLFGMAHIDKTKPRPCDKRVYLYTLNQYAKPVKASMTHCHGMGNTSCSRSVREGRGGGGTASARTVRSSAGSAVCGEMEGEERREREIERGRRVGTG